MYNHLSILSRYITCTCIFYFLYPSYFLVTPDRLKWVIIPDLVGGQPDSIGGNRDAARSGRVTNFGHRPARFAKRQPNLASGSWPTIGFGQRCQVGIFNFF